MAINVKALSSAMLAAAQLELANHWPDIREYAKAELKKTAETIAMIERLLISGDINKRQARSLLRMQKNASQAVLLTVAGLGLLTAESAINAALGVARTTVNTAVGFTLV